MNWGEILTQIIVGIVGILISALGVFITYLINKYVKDNNLKTILSSLNTLVQNSVLEVHQTYVETLKKAGNFDAEAQKQALETCLKLVKVNMTLDVKTWLEANYSDIDSYLKSYIEAEIAIFKKWR